MPAVSLLLTLAALFLLFRTAASRREAFFASLLSLGVLVTLITEWLSPLRLLHRAPLTMTWLAIFAATLTAALLRWRRLRRHSDKTAPARAQLSSAVRRALSLEGLAVAGAAAIAAIVGFLAVTSLPNSTDAMTYHLPRVVYWWQSGSVEFFATRYFNQLMLGSLAEYVVLHTYVLSGGDAWANLVQFFAMLGSVVGVSLIAKQLGAGSRGQALAALFCATLPNGILQASGAKNDYVLALWLVSSVWFALRFLDSGRRLDSAALGLSAGLAVLTKGTAYLFLPAVLLGVFLPALRKHPKLILQGVGAAAAGIVLLNGPQYWRNYELSGSPLGFDSAHGDGVYRWNNEKLGLRPVLSNLLRHLSDQLGARNPEWNQRVFHSVVHVHRFFGMDENDPATTWPGTRFEPPRNANHETNAANRWHLLLLVLAVFPLVWRYRIDGDIRTLVLVAGIVLAFLLFCFFLKWQLFLARLHLPLFVLASAAAGLAFERLKLVYLQLLLCLFLLNNSRPYLFENWVRPLKGPNSILAAPRELDYFRDLTAWNNREHYLEAVRLTRESGCTNVGIDQSHNEIEYPYQALLLRSNPAIRFRHVGVSNASVRYEKKNEPEPCVVFCPDCAGDQGKVETYRHFGPPVVIGRFLVFLRKGG